MIHLVLKSLLWFYSRFMANKASPIHEKILPRTSNMYILSLIRCGHLKQIKTCLWRTPTLYLFAGTKYARVIFFFCRSLEAQAKSYPTWMKYYTTYRNNLRTIKARYERRDWWNDWCLTWKSVLITTQSAILSSICTNTTNSDFPMRLYDTLKACVLNTVKQ